MMSAEDFEFADGAGLGDPGAPPVSDATPSLCDPAADVFEPAAWSCSAPVEQSVVVWTDLAPADGAPVPLSWCAPSGESAMLPGLDLNGDGIVDLVPMDANGDGVPDTWLLDTTAEPSAETGSCFADVMFVDTTGDGLPNCCCRDAAGTGTYTDVVELPPEAPVEPAPTQVAPQAPAPEPAPVPQQEAPAPAAEAPAPAAPAAPAASTGDPLIDAMSQTDDPQVIAQIQRMIDIRTRAASVWLEI